MFLNFLAFLLLTNMARWHRVRLYYCREVLGTDLISLEFCGLHLSNKWKRQSVCQFGSWYSKAYHLIRSLPFNPNNSVSLKLPTDSLEIPICSDRVPSENDYLKLGSCHNESIFVTVCKYLICVTTWKIEIEIEILVLAKMKAFL